VGVEGAWTHHTRTVCTLCTRAMHVPSHLQWTSSPDDGVLLCHASKITCAASEHSVRRGQEYARVGACLAAWVAGRCGQNTREGDDGAVLCGALVQSIQVGVHCVARHAREQAGYYMLLFW
jgi:hypothetical protein